MSNPTNRDRFTTASAAPENAQADFELATDGQTVDELAAKIHRQTKQSYAQAHIQAVRLLASVQ